jgi:hypothetical protein
MKRIEPRTMEEHDAQMVAMGIATRCDRMMAFIKRQDPAIMPMARRLASEEIACLTAMLRGDP